MSDISTGGTAAETTAAPAAAPTTSTAPVTTPAGAPTGDDDLSPFGEHAPYIKDLRNEAAKYRTQLANYKAFEAYDPEDLAVWTELAETLANDPAAAAQRFIELGTKLGEQYPGQKAAEAAAAAAEGGDADQPLTRAQLDALLKEREDAQALERQVQVINEQIASKFGEGTPDAHLALRFAANETNGDIDAAIAKVEEYRQGIVDQYLTGKQDQATKFGSPVTQAGQPAGEGGEVKTFGDAKARTLARLAAARTQ